MLGLLAIALGSKLPLLTQIAGIGLGMRLQVSYFFYKIKIVALLTWSCAGHFTMQSEALLYNKVSRFETSHKTCLICLQVVLGIGAQLHSGAKEAAADVHNRK